MSAFPMSLVLHRWEYKLSDKKLKALSLQKKKEKKRITILEAVSEGKRKKDVAAQFGIPVSSLSTISSAKNAIHNAVKAGRATRRN